MEYLVDQIINITGLKEFGTYISTAKPKTYCDDFDLQLDIAEQLYGQNLHFYFSESDMVSISERDKLYPSDVKKRVYQILLERKRKYKYLFKG